MKDRKYIIHVTDDNGNIFKISVQEHTICYWVDEFTKHINGILLIKMTNQIDSKIVKYYDGKLNSISKEEYTRRAKAYQFRKDFL